MSASPGQSPAAPVKWVEVPPSALGGEGLCPYPEGETAALFDWMEKPDAASTHLMPHFGQFIVDVVEIEDNAVHQPSKPGDELVVVLNGMLSLTTDGDQEELLIRAGEMVLIPMGWAGIYRVISQGGPFRELAIVPENYFDPTHKPPPSGQSPRRLELPTQPGKHELHSNRYVLEVENLAEARDWRVRTDSDLIIQVITGALTLTAADEAAFFPAGSVVILPRGFEGQASATADLRALYARWIG